MGNQDEEQYTFDIEQPDDVLSSALTNWDRYNQGDGHSPHIDVPGPYHQSQGPLPGMDHSSFGQSQSPEMFFQDHNALSRRRYSDTEPQGMLLDQRHAHRSFSADPRKRLQANLSLQSLGGEDRYSDPFAPTPPSTTSPLFSPPVQLTPDAYKDNSALYPQSPLPEGLLGSSGYSSDGAYHLNGHYVHRSIQQALSVTSYDETDLSSPVDTRSPSRENVSGGGGVDYDSRLHRPGPSASHTYSDPSFARGRQARVAARPYPSRSPSRASISSAHSNTHFAADALQMMDIGAASPTSPYLDVHSGSWPGGFHIGAGASGQSAGEWRRGEGPYTPAVSPTASGIISLTDFEEEPPDIGEGYHHHRSGQRNHVGSEAIVEASARRRKKPAKWACTWHGCSATFTAKHNLRNHINSHNGIKDFRCTLCDRSFGTAHVLRRHAKNCKTSSSAKSNNSAGSPSD